MLRLMTSILIAFAAIAASTASHAQSILKDHDTYQPIDITAGTLELKQNPSRALFIDAVKVIQGQMTLTSDNLTVFYLNEPESEDPKISRLDFEGKITVVSKTETLTGDWAIYDVDSRLITVGGNVVLTQSDNVLRGERLEFNLVSGRAKLDGQKKGENDGRVRGRFNVPDKKNQD